MHYTIKLGVDGIEEHTLCAEKLLLSNLVRREDLAAFGFDSGTTFSFEITNISEYLCTVLFTVA